MHRERNQSKRFHRLDRLRHLSLVGLLGLAACSAPKDAKPATEPQTRAVAVKAAEPDPKALEAFCDKSWADAAQAPAFGQGPKLRDQGPAPKAGWRWVNFWATWCAPCLEEMPMLGRWRDALQKEGAAFELELWSVDEDEAKLKARIDKGLPAMNRWVQSPEALSEYLGKLGLDPDAMLPIQMIIDPEGKLRCVRTGAVSENDYGTLKRLIGR